MFTSLRFRLPAFFLVGIVVSGVIATVVALALFQGYGRQQLLTKLRREANGLTLLYQRQGADGFPDQVSGLRQLPQDSIDWRSGQKQTFEFRPPGFKRTYLAVLQPMRL